MSDERTDRRARPDRRESPVTTDLRADRRAPWREERRERRVVLILATLVALVAPLLLLFGRSSSGRDDRTSTVSAGQVAETTPPAPTATPPTDTNRDPGAEEAAAFGGGAVRRFGEWATRHEGHDDPLRPGEVQPYAAEGIRLLGDALREVALARGRADVAEEAGALRPIADSLAPGMRRLSQAGLVRRAFTRAAVIVQELRAGGVSGMADTATRGATALPATAPFRTELAQFRSDRLLAAQGPAVRALFAAAAREIDRYAPAAPTTGGEAPPPP